MARRTLVIVCAALVAATVCASVVAAMLVPAGAHADGDPASDVLLGENVFYPYSPPVSSAVQKTLDAETAAAGKSHFPIKVALIGSPVDLGVIPDLFGKPQKYADFLDQEISFQGPQPLLVVMSTGYGVQGVRSGTSALGLLPRPVTGQPNDLARAAITAVARLAKAEGHPITDVSGVPGAATSESSTTLILVVLIVAALATAGTLLTIRRRQRMFG